MKNPLIVALDFESAERARELVDRLGDTVSIYKVGLELYAAAGMDFVKEMIGRGKDVFLDLKLYDINETVKRAVERIAASGVRFTTVHARKPVMRAAVEGRGLSNLQLLAVTVLTNFDQSDIAEMGYTLSVAELVALRVRQSMETGVGGIVCSPLEVAAVRKIAGPGTVLVVPGVRSAGAGKGDQKRVATPAEAMAGGADYLVIGRQVTRADDPAAEARRILEEIQAGQKR
jgi:orotidine-5'-phosphate decarboxylase